MHVADSHVENLKTCTHIGIREAQRFSRGFSYPPQVDFFIPTPMASTPHVAVLIESSRAYGRGLLEGIAQYIHQNERWSVFYQPRGLDDPLPNWLNGWEGNGIIARIND